MKKAILLCLVCLFAFNVAEAKKKKHKKKKPHMSMAFIQTDKIS